MREQACKVKVPRQSFLLSRIRKTDKLIDLVPNEVRIMFILPLVELYVSVSARHGTSASGEKWGGAMAISTRPQDGRICVSLTSKDSTPGEFMTSETPGLWLGLRSFIHNLSSAQPGLAETGNKVIVA